MLELLERFLIWRFLISLSSSAANLSSRKLQKEFQMFLCFCVYTKSSSNFLFPVLPIANLLFFFPFPSECAFFEWWNRPILQFLIFSVCRKMETKRTISIYVKGKVKKSALVIVNRTGCSLKSIHLGVNWYKLLSRVRIVNAVSA